MNAYTVPPPATKSLPLQSIVVAPSSAPDGMNIHDTLLPSLAVRRLPLVGRYQWPSEPCSGTRPTGPVLPPMPETSVVKVPVAGATVASDCDWFGWLPTYCEAYSLPSMPRVGSLERWAAVV